MLDWKYKPKEKTTPEEPSKDAIAEEKPESFASRHVKVITFIVCMAVFFVLCGPVNVFWLWQRKHDGYVDGIPMTQADLIRLSEQENLRTIADLQKYEGQRSDGENRIFYTIEFDHYILLCIGDKNTMQVLTCSLEDTETEDQVDVLTGNVRAFFDTH